MRSTIAKNSSGNQRALGVLAIPAVVGFTLLAICYPRGGLVSITILLGAFGAACVSLLRLIGFGDIRVSQYCGSFGALFLWVGIAQIYNVYLGDFIQTASDPVGFFELSRTVGIHQTLEELRAETVGGFAVYVGRLVYGGARLLGVDAEQYIGIVWNTTLVAISIALVAGQLDTFTGDASSAKHRRFIFIASSSGMLGIFAGMHLRDTYALFTTVLVGIAWVRLLATRSMASWIRLIVTASGCLAIASHIRLQGELLLVAVCAAGSLLYFFGKLPNFIKLLAFPVGAAAFLVLAQTSVEIGEEDLAYYRDRRRAYSDAVDAGSSLANRYVVSAAMPVRIVTGAVYLHVFPIPFWAGYSEGSAYYLFKTLQSLWSMLLAPAVIIGLWWVALGVWRGARSAEPPAFVAIFYLLGVGAVVASSLETRHLGQFLLFYALLATLGIEMRDQIWQRRRRLVQLLVYGGIAAGYFAWGVIKFR
jgi:hypothetical protein